MTELIEMKLQKKFFENMLLEGVTKDDLKNFKAYKTANYDKYNTDKSLLNDIQQERNFKELYGHLVNRRKEWDEGGNMKIPICACHTRIHDLHYRIYNFKDANEGKKITLYRVGSSCVGKFVGLSRVCLICGNYYKGNNPYCNEKQCKEEYDKKKEKEHQKYLSTLCIDCKHNVVKTEKYKRCYSCYMKYKSTQSRCIDCSRMCNHPFVRCFHCNLKYKINQ